ncbi:MAG: Zn-dependent hydrolase [Rhodospirillales bacterium]
MDPGNIRIDLDRLWRTLDASAQIGKGRANGLRRLALSDSDQDMRRLFVDWCKAEGLKVSRDSVANLFARRDGTDNDLPPVVIGSHLDTQVAGGRFDGILGVLAGLEVIRTLNETGVVTRHPIEVACWTNEEGARFQPPMMGSLTHIGALDLDWVRAQADDDGVSVGEELDRFDIECDVVPFKRIFDSYFELHIEQAPELERANVPVGVVVGGYKAHGLRVKLTGMTGHAGPTEMPERRDALAAAAKIISSVYDIGCRFADTGGKATSPRLLPWPNKPGIICEIADLTMDCRHPEPQEADAMLADIEAAIATHSETCGVDVEILQRWSFGDEVFSDELIELVKNASDKIGAPHREMLSQAGHDAYAISRVAPTALIFSPCKDGISHNEAEDIDRMQTEPGLNVLLHAVLARANRAAV